MPKKQDKTREEKAAENHFKIDQDDLKSTTEKKIKHLILENKNITEKKIKDFSETETDGKKRLQIQLLSPVVRHHYKRVSKPGRRMYSGVGTIPRVIRGFGIIVISTSQGIMTGKSAKKLGLGGEVLFEAY